MGNAKLFGVLVLSVAVAVGAIMLFRHEQPDSSSLQIEPIEFVPTQVINVPNDYSSIQAAIDSAIPGTLIEIAPGTYNESIVIDKSIWITGSGAESTIIQAENSSQYQNKSFDTYVAVDLRNENREPIDVNLKDITIIGHSILANTSDARSVAVYVDGAINGYFQDVSVVGSNYGVRVTRDSSGSKLSFLRSQFSGGGTGIFLLGNSNCYHQERYFVDLFIEGTEFVRAQNSGSAIYQHDVCGSRTKIVNSTFQTGLVFWVEADATITDSTFNGNSTLVVYGSDVTVRNSTISSNESHGIRVSPYNWGKSVLELHDSIVEGNAGYGLVVSGRECFGEDHYPAFWDSILDDVEIRGSNNTISRNKLGDVCPTEYPIPHNFLVQD